jgi:hypothetical protein
MRIDPVSASAGATAWMKGRTGSQAPARATTTNNRSIVGRLRLLKFISPAVYVVHRTRTAELSCSTDTADAPRSLCVGRSLECINIFSESQTRCNCRSRIVQEVPCPPVL